MTKQEERKVNPKSKEQEKGQQEAETVSISRTEYEELLRKAGELCTLQDKLLRSAADFENARKRLVKEREDFLKFALEEVIYDLLPIVDNFELALNHVDAGDEKAKSIRDGLILVQKQLFSVLNERGLSRIQTVGKIFDPHLHEAVGHVIKQGEQEGIILEEVLAGYQLNGKLLRPAKVKISAKESVSEVQEKSEELT